MCGIAGAVGSGSSDLVRAMTEALYHRGPDSGGHFRGDHVKLGIRRLSIIDLISGDQPIYNEARDKCIVFNGEIYNYRELRRELTGKGHRFETNTDTEVILRLYEEYGEQCVARLRGMFAFAIADGDSLFIARDRLGIKPLYFALVPERGLFVFASETKALLRCEELSVGVSARAMADYALLGYVFGDETFIDPIKCLRPGCHMRVTPRPQGLKVEERQYYRLSLAPDESLSYEAAEEALHELLDESVGSHLVADVEVGLSLSGGVDSTLLAMLMGRHYPGRISTFTVGEYAQSPDLQQSRIIADHIRSDHTEVILSFEDYVRAIPRCTLTSEHPMSLFGMPFYFLCAAVGGKVKVCLNGEGADELFGGYPQYFDPFGRVSALRDSLPLLGGRGLAPGDEAVAFVEELAAAARTPDEYLQRLLLANLQDQLVRNHLEVVDRYSMAFGLEMRVPFLDHELVNFVNALPLGFKVNEALGVGKYILKKALSNRFGRVTTDVVLRKKLGFPSAGFYYLTRFSDLCEASLPDSYVEKHDMRGYFAPRHRDGRIAFKRDPLMFDLFRRIFIDFRGTLPDDFDLMDFIREKASGS